MKPKLFSKTLGKLSVSVLALGLVLGAARGASAQSVVVHYAHFAYGAQTNGSWTTTDNYTNGTGASGVSGNLELFTPSGTQNSGACEVDFSNGTVQHFNPCNNIPITLGASQLSALGLTIKGEPGVSVQTGWSKITFPAPVGSSRKFAFASDGSNLPKNDPYTEVAVLPGGPTQIFGASVGPNAGIAFANPGFFGLTGTATITGSLYDNSGNLVAQNSGFSLALNQQTAKLIGGSGGFFPNAPANFSGGYALFTSDQAFIVTAFNFEATNAVGVDIPIATGPKAALKYSGTFAGTNGVQAGTFSISLLPNGRGRFSCLLTVTPTGVMATTVGCEGSTLVDQKGDVTFHVVQTDAIAQGGGSLTGGFSADRTAIQGVLMTGPGGGFSYNGTFTGTAVGAITW